MSDKSNEAFFTNEDGTEEPAMRFDQLKMCLDDMVKQLNETGGFRMEFPFGLYEYKRVLQ